MEETILKALEYKLTYPTPYTFLKRFLRGSVHDGIFEENDETMENLSLMILDSTLLSFHGTSRTYLPSQLAAGAIALARRTLLEDNGQHLSGANTIWNPTHEALTSYTERDVMEIAKDLFKCHQEAINSTRLRSLVKKYSKPKYGKVSSIQVLSLNSANGE
jgi:cyclin B